MKAALSRSARVVLVALSLLAFLAHAAAADKKQLPDKPINLNLATQKELEELPGIGQVTAKAILQFRQKSGPFHRVEDLLAIRGISERKLSRIRPYVTVTNAKIAPAQPSKPTKP